MNFLHVLRSSVLLTILMSADLFIFNIGDASAQRMGKKACNNANWLVIGADDALSGRSEDTALKRKEQCEKRSIEANLEDWQTGYDVMLPVLCTAEFSFGLGKYGNKLEASCPAETFDDIVEANNIGYEYYKLRSAYDRAVKGYNDDVYAINSAHNDIKQAQHKLSKSDLSADDIQKQRKKLSRAIERSEYLERTIDYMKLAAEVAEDNYLDFKPTATVFQLRIAIEKELHDEGPTLFDPSIMIDGVIIEGKEGGLFFDVRRAANPVLFDQVYVKLADFAPPRDTREGEMKCSLERKLKRRIKKEWKKLKNLEASVDVLSMAITPPKYQSNYSAFLVGDIILSNGESLAAYFIDNEMGVDENTRPLSGWYKNKECFSGPALPDGEIFPE
jgi:Protein of unknown function (DUF2799)